MKDANGDLCNEPGAMAFIGVFGAEKCRLALSGAGKTFSFQIGWLEARRWRVRLTRPFSKPLALQLWPWVEESVRKYFSERVAFRSRRARRECTIIATQIDRKSVV